MRILTFAASLLVFSAAPAVAQDAFPAMDWSNVGWSAVNNSIGQEINKSSESNSEPARSKVPAPAKASVNLDFAPSMQVRKANLARFVNKTRATDPGGAAAMQQLFASTDIIGQIGQSLVPFGLRTNNVADAYTVYWMNAWQAANGDNSDFTLDQSQAVKQQAENALLATPSFQTATDAVKQEMAEAYLIQAALIGAAAEVAKSDPVMAKNLASSVRSGASASGLNLDEMVLTSEGFKPTGK